MSSLQYKTRGDSNPKGKPKVYFCCHPEDFDKYFEKISQELLAEQNCAIWYLEGPNAEHDEQFFSDLELMQLFVMPVTSKLLSTPNQALDAEFPFAVEKHIPILPLMQEKGLETLFNQKCGNLQFLDKYSGDVTALKYEEKLKTYLNTVLIGDELAEKIRSAFDAYVFLSYRKKDRRYAQELMRLVHKNDFCRDIAIWYDEFLTPGENFNDSIQDVLQKSDLFLLAVTPNLVNETNYIMTTEYPMARKSGKPILPAELVPTDKALLAEKYAQLPVCADAHNDQQLSGALLDALKQLALRENDSSPEHNFFIGLAYLGGIDVEVDHAHALFLITSAADAGLPEALEKLVDMYRTGTGVAKSDENAVFWQEKMISLRTEEYRNDPTEEKLDQAFWSIYKCAEILTESSQFSKAIEKYQSAYSLLKSEEQFHKSPIILRDLSKYYIGMGNAYIAKESGQWLQDEYSFLHAKSLFEHAKRVLFKIEDPFFNWNKEKPFGNRSVEMDCDFAEADIAMGKAYLHMTWNDELGRYTDEAEYCFQGALSSYRTLSDYLGPEQHKRALALCYEGLAEVYHTRFDFVQARKYYEKTIQLRTELVEETREDADRANLEFTRSLLDKMHRDEASVTRATASRKPIDAPTLTRTVTKETIVISSFSFILGRERRSVNYQIPDNLSVSRTHARVITRGREYFIEDISSRDGTFVNGERIPAYQEVKLHDGDAISLGTEAFTFHAKKS